MARSQRLLRSQSAVTSDVGFASVVRLRPASLGTTFAGALGHGLRLAPYRNYAVFLTQHPQQIVVMRTLSTPSTVSTGKLARMLLIYDGQCDFCIRSAAWIRARLPAAARVEPWQEVALKQFGLSETDVQTSVWWIEGANKFSGAQAIGRSLIASGGSWALVGRVLIHPPVSWLAELSYRWVAANRHRLSWMHKTRRTH